MYAPLSGVGGVVYDKVASPAQNPIQFDMYFIICCGLNLHVSVE